MIGGSGGRRALAGANVVSGRSREQEFTSPAASLLSSHDHPAGWIGRFWMRRWLVVRRKAHAQLCFAESWRYAGNPSPTALFFQQCALFCCRHRAHSIPAIATLKSSQNFPNFPTHSPPTPGANSPKPVLSPKKSGKMLAIFCRWC